MTWKRDVQDAEYRVGQTVIRRARQKSRVKFGQRLTIEGLGWAC